jgi:hypothetical protein
LKKKEATKIGKRISDLCKELSAYNYEKICLRKKKNVSYGLEKKSIILRVIVI